MNTQRVLCLFACIVLVNNSQSLAMHMFDNPHFFRANHFFGEPRFEKKWLTSVANGGATKRIDHCHSDFKMAGNLTVFEAIFLLTQNLTHGLFLQLHVPFRSLHIKNIRWNDPLTDTHSCDRITSWSERGIADVSAYIGWTRNYQDTEKIDFVDMTGKIGVIAGGKSDSSFPFDIPIGYNGHTAASLGADLSIGAYQWVTIGWHLRTLLFAPAKKRPLCIEVRPGTIIEVGSYGKADHIIRGLSLLVGYSAVYKRQDSAPYPIACDVWNMHTLHYLIEYDFSKEGRILCPRLSLYCDEQVSGKNVFKVNMTGLGLGIEIAW